MDFYNDNDHSCCVWLSNLMYADLIPFGHISRASIRDLRSSDIPPSTRQAHFFAGIGGWPLALQLANWPSSIPVWTGSCPCQPYSVAGKRKGDADDRNLWPQFLRLIRHHRPPVCFGEQVAGKDGKVWLDGVRSDLEKLGYEVGAADLCAAGVGAPHIRQRLYWVAFATGQGWERRIVEAIREEQQTVERGGVIGGVAHSQSTLRGPSPLHWPDHINEIQKGPQSPSSSGERGQSCSAGWPTARTSDADKSVRTMEGSLREVRRKGGPQDLGAAAFLAGWSTPNTPSGGPNTKKTKTHRGGMDLDGQATLVLSGWTTSQTHDAQGTGSSSRLLRHGTKHGCKNLQDEVHLTSGPTSSSSPASTATTGALNPEHTRYLMGFLPGWSSYAVTETP